MAKPSADPTERFFEELAARGFEPLLQKGSGTTRIEVVDGRRTDRWMVSVDKGTLRVTHANARADCVVRADKAVFDRIASGRLNAVAAVLRGELAVDGDWRLLVLMQRLFPGHPSRGRKRA